MNKIKRPLIILLLIFLIITAIYLFGYGRIKKSMKSYDSFSFRSIDLSQVEDGTYTGSEDGGIVKATVDVTVKNHSITKVLILSHDSGKGKPAEVIINDIIDHNSLEVDTISGATYSSNVIRAAIYHALVK